MKFFLMFIFLLLNHFKIGKKYFGVLYPNSSYNEVCYKATVLYNVNTKHSDRTEQMGTCLAPK